MIYVLRPKNALATAQHLIISIRRNIASFEYSKQCKTANFIDVPALTFKAPYLKLMGCFRTNLKSQTLNPNAMRLCKISFEFETKNSYPSTEHLQEVFTKRRTTLTIFY